MIKLVKNAPPLFLTEAKAQELTQEFIAGKALGKEIAVWRDEDGFIREAILEESNNKCVYCECKIERAGAGLEVEHFMPKGHHPNLVVDWNNLLASCRRCNTKKSSKTNKNTKEIINPYTDTPGSHLDYRFYRFVGKDLIGCETVKKLDLNDRVKLVLPRFEVSDVAIGKLVEISLIKDIVVLRNAINEILQLCQAHTEFSLVTATAVHNDSNYKNIVLKLKNESLWDDDLEALHQASSEILYQVTEC